jgi:ABC-2 type transport system permease protein
VFLVVQGIAQVSVIFVTAWLVHGVDLPGHLGGCLAVTAAASFSAAGLALALTTACATRRQAQAFANVAILMLSALGGSMVPRFFMPPLLQRIGWLTPNTWALEAYASVFWREQGPAQLVLPVGLLLASGACGALVALRLARRHETL